jgi:hypothetical protein
LAPKPEALFPSLAQAHPAQEALAGKSLQPALSWAYNRLRKSNAIYSIGWQALQDHA